MAQTQEGVYRRQDSRFWWIATTLPNGKRIRQSAGTETRQDAEALLAKIRLEAFREHHFGIKAQRSWQEAVVRYLTIKANLRSFRDVNRICRMLDPYLVSGTGTTQKGQYTGNGESLSGLDSQFAENGAR